jgi:hypothetical protein
MKILKLFIFLTILFLAHSLYAEVKLSPFETDGCTMFVNGTIDRPDLWKHCCVEHDLRYWFGGSQADIDKTDLRLKSCVEKVASVTWGTLIYNGVRAGHYSPIKNKSQWGWGWNSNRAKTSLTKVEKSVILIELQKVNVPEVNIEEFIKFYFP